jgi:hypothetical protein
LPNQQHHDHQHSVDGRAADPVHWLPSIVKARAPSPDGCGSLP